MCLIWHAAVYWANGGTLWLFVKALALGTFIRYDVVHVVIDRLLCIIRIR